MNKTNSPFARLDTSLMRSTKQQDTQKPASPQAVLPTRPQEDLPVNPQEEKPASGFTHITASPQAGKIITEVVEKYTTRLEPSLIKRVKHYALEHDIKDYEVVKQAVKEYLEKEK